MKSILVIICMLISVSSLAMSGLTYKDQVKVQKVVLGTDILLNNLTKLYSDYYFEDRMLAKAEDIDAKKSKKMTWSDNLRRKLNGSSGIYRL